MMYHAIVYSMWYNTSWCQNQLQYPI